MKVEYNDLGNFRSTVITFLVLYHLSLKWFFFYDKKKENTITENVLVFLSFSMNSLPTGFNRIIDSSLLLI